MFKKDPITGPVRSAIKAVETVLSERRKIRGAIDAAIAEQPRAEQAYQQALERLAIAEADAALGGAPEQPEAAQQAAQRARLRMDALGARIHGLQARLAATDDAVVRAADEFASAKRGFIGEQLDRYDGEYRTAAEAFAAVIRRGLALAAGLNVTLPGLQSIEELPMPRSLEKPAVRFRHTWIRDGQRYPRARWEGDADAEAIIESFSTFRNCVDTLASETKAIEASRHAAAQQAAEKAAENLPKTSGLTYAQDPRDVQPPIPKVEIKGATMFPDDPARRAGIPQHAHMNPSE